MYRKDLKTNLQRRPYEEQHFQPVAPMKQPLIMGYMSVDVAREYHGDLSQLKFLTNIPSRQLLNYDLNHNIEKAVKRTTDDNDEKISLLLKFILDRKECLKSLITQETLIISYRRTFISVMCNIYNNTPVTIVASLFKNCIYLCSLEDPQEVSRKKSSNKELDKFCAWGYKFEQYMLSDSPNGKPDIETPVIENEEFSLYYYSELQNHRLFYGAQIDGMLATRGPVQDVPMANNVNDNVAYLRQNCYVELKTSREMSNRHQLNNFKKYKLLRCWCQCYLAGLKGLLVGYRNDDGIIQRVEWFDTAGIERFCKNYWRPDVVIGFLDQFLSYVKESFKSKFGENCDSSQPLSLKFNIDENHQFSVNKIEDDPHIILPQWYTDNIQM